MRVQQGYLLSGFKGLAGDSAGQVGAIRWVAACWAAFGEASCQLQVHLGSSSASCVVLLALLGLVSVVLAELGRRGGEGTHQVRRMNVTGAMH